MNTTTGYQNQPIRQPQISPSSVYRQQPIVRPINHSYNSGSNYSGGGQNVQRPVVTHIGTMQNSQNIGRVNHPYQMQNQTHQQHLTVNQNNKVSSQIRSIANPNSNNYTSSHNPTFLTYHKTTKIYNTDKNFDQNYVKNSVAETIGLTNIDPIACDYIAKDLNFALKRILAQAVKYQRKCKTTTVNTMNIKSAIDRLHPNQKKNIGGHRTYDKSIGLRDPNFDKHDFIENTDENLAEASKNLEGTKSKSPMKRLNNSNGSNGTPLVTQNNRPVYQHLFHQKTQKQLHILNDQVIDVKQFLNNAEQNVKFPLDVIIKPHWLLIDGIQPAIPENPALDLTLPSGETEIKVPSKNLSHLNDTNSIHRQDLQIQQGVKPLVKNELSLEQQMYYKEITEAVVGLDTTGQVDRKTIDKKRCEAINSLKYDTGLKQILPRLISFFAEGIKFNILTNYERNKLSSMPRSSSNHSQFIFDASQGRSLDICVYLTKMIEALCSNKAIDLAKYLHEILPNLLTLICSSKISNDENSTENHWKMRHLATKLVVKMVKSYTSTKNNLELRVIGMAKKRLEGQKAGLDFMASSNSNNFPDETMKQKLNSSIMTRFGCLYILRELGTNSIFECLLPLLKTQFQFTAQIHQIFGQSPADVHLISGVSKLEGLFLASENHSTFNNHKFFQELMKNPNILTQKIGGRSKTAFENYFGQILGKNLFDSLSRNEKNSANPGSNLSTNSDNLPENTTILGRETPNDNLPDSVKSDYIRGSQLSGPGTGGLATIEEDLNLSESSDDDDML